MFKRFLLASVLAASVSAVASAAPITGSFSLGSFGGSYVGGSAPTAMTATGLDFGSAFGGPGNGYGTNGTAIVGNGVGSFASLTGQMASIADISLGATANPYLSNPFISFGAASSIVLNFSDALIQRLSTSITVSGTALFSDGVPADASVGTFTLSTSNQTGTAADVKFTFTSNQSVNAVPEPVSLSILGAGLVGLGLVRRRGSKVA